jgi:hypothetical protein
MVRSRPAGVAALTAAVLVLAVPSGCSRSEGPTLDPSNAVKAPVPPEASQQDDSVAGAISDVSSDRSATSAATPTEDRSAFELDPARQDQIWEAEHITFELEKCVGPRFWAAIRAGGAGDWSTVLRPEFRGRCALEAVSQGTKSGGRIVWSRLRAPERPADLAADMFQAELARVVGQLSNHKSGKFRVLSIRRDSEAPDLWLCRIYLASKGTSADGALIHFASESDVAFRFSDEAELHDRPVIESWQFASLAQESIVRPMFREVTAEVGLENTGIDDNWKLPPEQVLQYRFQMAVDDFNLDGWLDFATAENHLSRIFQWQPQLGRFIQVTDRVGVSTVHGKSGSGNSLAGFFDMDNDGDPDLLLGNRLLRNEQGKSFSDVTAESGLKFLKKATGVHFADFDADGLLDIYVLYQGNRERSGNEPPLSWVQDDNTGEENHLWKNLGAGRFRNVTLSRKAGGGRRHSLAASVFHYDDDHLPDIYIANDFCENNLLRNRGADGFEDVSHVSGTSDYATSMGVVAGDVDNDGRSDLYVANMFSKMGRRIIGHVSAADYPDGVFPLIQGSCAGNRLYRRTESIERFDEFGEQLGIHDIGWAYAPAMADFNNDGLLDLYAATGFLSFQRNEPDG